MSTDGSCSGGIWENGGEWEVAVAGGGRGGGSAAEREGPEAARVGWRWERWGGAHPQGEEVDVPLLAVVPRDVEERRRGGDEEDAEEADDHPAGGDGDAEGDGGVLCGRGGRVV